jgi:aspartate 1-decarboxylase
VIGINGAAARLSQVGHRVIVMSFVMVGREELGGHYATVVIAGEKNQVAQTLEIRSSLK